GREVDVLVESTEPTESQTGEAIVVGRTYRDAPEVDGLAFLKGTYPAGSVVRARVDGALPYDLLCTPLLP
ncbi:MAG: 30S ribosomal protein S12 methylthiotransferase RimO, partial [Dehalococcoidia bacterium]